MHLKWPRKVTGKELNLQYLKLSRITCSVLDIGIKWTVYYESNPNHNRDERNNGRILVNWYSWDSGFTALITFYCLLSPLIRLWEEKQVSEISLLIEYRFPLLFYYLVIFLGDLSIIFPTRQTPIHCLFITRIFCGCSYKGTECNSLSSVAFPARKWKFDSRVSKHSAKD